MLFSKTNGSSPEEKSRWKMLLILGGAVLGVILLVFGGQLSNEREEAPQEQALSEEQGLTEYRLQLEERIRVLCESVAGVSGVRVAVTLEGGFETVYATEPAEGGYRYVTVGSGSSASALPLSRREPMIAGIGIVCVGGSNANIRRELIDLLSSAFDVSGNRIYVTEAKK